MEESCILTTFAQYYAAQYMAAADRDYVDPATYEDVLNQANNKARFTIDTVFNKSKLETYMTREKMEKQEANKKNSLWETRYRGTGHLRNRKTNQRV